MAKLKKILISEAKSLYEDSAVCNFNIKGVEISCKKYLSINEKLQFMKFVLSTCIINGIYYPALFDFSVRRATVELYSNVSVPSGNKKSNDLVYGSGIYESLMEFINKEEHKALVESAREEIKNLTRVDGLEQIAKSIDSFLKTAESEIGTVDIQQLNKLVSLVSSSTEKGEFIEQFRDLYVKDSNNENT